MLARVVAEGLLDGWRQTGLVCEAGVVAGAGGSCSLALGLRKAPRGDAYGGGAFLAGGASFLSAGARGYLSHNPKLRGIEYNLANRSWKSPVYGDMASVPILPGGIDLGASRRGGLGLRFSLVPIPIPGLTFVLPAIPLVRLGAVRVTWAVYVTNPVLAPPANWILDRFESLDRLVLRVLAPVGRTLRPIGRLARRIGKTIKDHLPHCHHTQPGEVVPPGTSAANSAEGGHPAAGPSVGVDQK